MGLIRAGIGAMGGTLADQWKEFFYCDSMGKDVLVTKGQKRTTGRSSNTKGNDNIISNGSGIAVADGQCMIIVEQGKVVEVCAEPGEFTYDTSTEPSIFSGNLGESIKETFKTVGKRFTYGGDTGKDQRIYYFNTKDELLNTLSMILDDNYEILKEKMDPDMNSYDKLLYLNYEAHSMIEEKINIDLLASLYSTQLVAQGHRSLLDQNRTYYKLISSVIDEGQKRGEISDEVSVSDLVRYYSMCERALVSDWCLNKGEYSLREYSKKCMPVMLEHFKR